MNLSTRIRSWAGFGEPTELQGGLYFVKLEMGRPCEACGGSAVATFSASGSGYSCGSSYLHEPGCPTLRCKHDTLWTHACVVCDAEEFLDGAPQESEDES